MAIFKEEIRISPSEFAKSKDDLLGLVKRKFPNYSAVNAVVLDRKSLDARKREVVYQLRFLIYTEADKPTELKMPALEVKKESEEIHIVGFGPAGIFAAIECLKQGHKPIVYERGKAVRQRRRDVALLNRDGILNPESNYCFGEGGAGTFSDGKLYTRSTKRGKIQDILELFVMHGANENILYEAHPHIGTNKLPEIIAELRKTIIACGGEVHFNSRLNDLRMNGSTIEAIQINEFWINANHLILATGHSAHDIYELLQKHKIKIEAKPFAMGFRMEHPQELIDSIQYDGSTDKEDLPPASYSLVTQVNGKGAFSFCMCPGGIIAPATTDMGRVVVNGWSPSKRNGAYANSGWVTEIDEEAWSAYKDKGELAGLEFQKSIELKAAEMGGGEAKVPAQNLNDYLNGKKSVTLNESSYHPGMTSVDLNKLYPEAINERLREGLRTMTRKLKGFDHEKAVLVAPESRTSAPIRIPRTPDLNHPEITNLYPCAEGAGYAGGILSAAMDGIRVVKSITKKALTE